MKAITVKQPWASLIIQGGKDIENRTWKTNVRGRVLIHASGVYDNNYKTVINNDVLKDGKVRNVLNGNIPKSAILGSVEIADCVQNHPSKWAEKGVYNWVLKNPIVFDKPIENVKGKLSFWQYDGEVPK